MNWKVIAVLFVGAAALAVINIYPPWKFDDVYRGHSSIFSTAFMEVDNTRLLIEEVAIVAATFGLAVFLRRRR